MSLRLCAHKTSMAAHLPTSANAPTLVDRSFQLGYKLAYRMMRARWRLTNPLTHGALVLLWNQGEVLLVRNSYVPYYSAPGGFVKRTEDASQAASRELAEEVGLHIAPEALSLSLEVTHDWEGKRDHVKVFELELPERPEVHVDNREVVDAVWVKPSQAVTLNVFPPLKQVIERRMHS